mgnify:CR=1 FL=1
MNYFELLKKFSEHSGQLMAEVKDLPSMQGAGNKRHLLTSIHKLNIDLNTKFVELDRIKSDLNKVTVFLKRFPTRKYYEENKSEIKKSGFCHSFLSFTMKFAVKLHN